MRHLLLFLLLTLGSSLFAQSPTLDAEIKYVWAKSGLTVRAEGKASGRKTAVLPYGTRVMVMEQYAGDRVPVTVVEAFEFPFYGETAKSEAVLLDDHYVKVELTDGGEGYVYDGYLSSYPTPKAGEDNVEWLARIGGTPTRTEKQYDGMIRQETRYVYPAGILRVDQQFEGGGGTTYVFPLGDRNEALLLADHLYNVFEDLEKAAASGDGEGNGYDDGLRYGSEEQREYFQGEMWGVEISVVGGVIVISSEGGC